MFRSLLFIPANNPSMLQNADIFLSDGVIFDLEDAIAPQEKDNARHLLETYLKTNPSLPRLICLRINDVFSNEADEDLRLLSTEVIDYIVLPKANVQSLMVLDKKLNDLENAYEIHPVHVLCLVEQSKGVIEVNEIAAHERVKGIILGAEDLANELEIERTNQGEEIAYARSRVIFACANQRIISIDTPFTDINDQAALEQDCLRAKQLGMKAKTAIHPSQIELINQIFSPSQTLIDWAIGVMKIYEQDGQSLFQYEGKMIDKPVIERAKKIIEKAKQYQLL